MIGNQVSVVAQRQQLVMTSESLSHSANDWIFRQCCCVAATAIDYCVSVVASQRQRLAIASQSLCHSANDWYSVRVIVSQRQRLAISSESLSHSDND